MEAEFKLDLCRRVMIIKRQADERKNFREKMLMKNSIEGVAKVNIRYLNGESFYSYDMGSCRTIKDVFEGNDMSLKELRSLLSGLSAVSHELEKYLLDMSDLLLDPENVLWDLEKEEPRFCYYPDSPEGSTASMELGQFLIDVVDKNDEEATKLAYSYFDRICEGMVLPDDIVRIPKTSADEKKNEKTFETQLPGSASEILTESDLWNDDNRENYYLEEEMGSGIAEEKKKNPLILFAAFIPAIVASLSYGYLFLNPDALAAFGLSDSDYIRAGIGVTVFSGLFIAIGVYFWNKKKKEEEDRKKDMDSLNSDIAGEEYRFDELEQRSMEKVMESRDNDYDATVLLSRTSPVLKGKVNGEEQTFEINRTPFMIGKMRNKADGVISDSGVSRIHACIRSEGGHYYLSDLNSTNGTCLNDRKLSSNETAELSDGDRVRFAGVSMTFRLA